MSSMHQTLLPVVDIPSGKMEELEKLLKEIYNDARQRFKKLGTFQKVLIKSASFGSKDLCDEQLPEEFTKRIIIEPFIEFLGYETVPETMLLSPTGKKKPDYIIKPSDKIEPIFYVEAEPLNIDLNSKEHGVSQVRDWLISRASKTDYGIATDGFKWILLKFDNASAQSKPFHIIDLRPIFLKIHNPASFVSPKEVKKIEKDFLFFCSSWVSLFLEGTLERLEIEKEEISKRFYHDYVNYVFGYDEKGNKSSGICLLDKVKAPSEINDNDINLFAAVFMNRLIFIRFLEEKQIVPKNLLKKMLESYRKSGTPASFYETFLRPLFYEVFNKNRSDRVQTVQMNPLYNKIPYLNGGLFREIITSEKNYTIENEGIELVLESLLENYNFGLDSDINPDILGYIFEKTINFISGTGSDQQKMKGAYYTPDNAVTFIIEETLSPILFQKMIDGLRISGWNDTDLKGYSTVEDILENLPNNPKHIKNMIKLIDTIKVLDPACGSGHFLTAMLSQILRVKESLVRLITDDYDRYHLKREIISQNLFGVDIDNIAVEIARLRLWLSIIEEVVDPNHIDTLPNIDFNIVTGNSLIGWLNENLLTHPLINLLEDSYIKKSIYELNEFYPDQTEEIIKMLGSMKLKETILAFEKLVDIYSLESGNRALKVRDVITGIQQKLYSIINSSYINFILESGNLNKEELKFVSNNLHNRIPFHWKLDFGKVFLDGGFDIVVGNPPYIEDRNYAKLDLAFIKCMSVDDKKKRTKRPLIYYSKNCGNTHAYFIERSINLIRKNGKFSFIVPLSLVSTNRMSSIREFIHNNSCEVNYYNFDDRPAKIFSGLEDCRATIFVIKKGKGLKKIYTSKYHRWFSKNSSQLFKNLKTINWRLKEVHDIIPKLGTSVEKKILKKLDKKSRSKTIEDFQVQDGERIWYHNAPRYWVHSHTDDYLPLVEYYEGFEDDGITPKNLQETKASDQYKSLLVKLDNSDIINGLLNSSLFYWWYVIWSDGRHLLAQHIKSFPIDLNSFSKDSKDKLNQCVTELMESYEKNSNIKINERSGGYVIKIKEMIPSKSKDIIKKIDEIFAVHFNFTEKENNFIREFDQVFRF